MLKKAIPIILSLIISLPLFGFTNKDIRNDFIDSNKSIYKIEENKKEEPINNGNTRLETKEEQLKREERETQKKEEERMKIEKELEKRRKENSKKKKEKPKMKLNEDGELVEETEEEKLLRETKEEEKIQKIEKQKREKKFNTTDVQYQVELQLDWTKETHPKDYPKGGYFTKFIGVTHTKKGGLWKNGGATSKGLLDVIKEGKLGEVKKEMKKQREKDRVNDIFEMEDVTRFPRVIGTKFKTSRDRPYVTLAAGIIPSPDWFIGVSSVRLLDKDIWLKEKEVIIYAYDAGTHEGTTYKSKTKKSKNISKIMRIEMEPFIVERNIVPVGKAIFRLIEETMPQEQYNTSFEENMEECQQP